MTKRKQKNENPLNDPFAPPLDRQYYSVAFLCQMFQQPPEFIFRMMRAAEVEFAWAENGVGVIRGDGIVKMKQTLAEVNEAVEDSAAKCAAAPNN